MHHCTGLVQQVLTLWAAVQQWCPALTEGETNTLRCHAGHLLEAVLWSSTWQLPQAAEVPQAQDSLLL